MEILVAVLIIVLLVRWYCLRERFEQIEHRFEAMEAAVRRVEWAQARKRTDAFSEGQAAPGPPVATPESEARFGPPTVAVAPAPPNAPAPPSPAPISAPAPVPLTAAPPSTDWELVVGGNWLNKIGVFVSVIALALLLNYAWTNVGHAGRVAMSYATAAVMLAAGVWSERRERFRTFAYGLIGGGWAALYLTTYAMYAIPSAKILYNAVLATVLLFAVALGMIGHSLKYRSETVAALAFAIAFVTLSISEVTTFSVLALIPLAGALLFIAFRQQWDRFAVFGLVATYLTCGLHKDTGAPLWQTQGLFLAYWLLFEAFDIVRANPALLPLNAIGFLLLSSGKWSHAEPGEIWQLAAGASVLYLASTVLRVPSGRWRPAVSLNAALATTAILLKLHDHWVASALLILAELYYLAGIRFGSQWLRGMAGCLFTLEVGHVIVNDAGSLPLRTWEPVAIATAAVFYLNRFLRAGDVVYGYVAAGLAALVSGMEATDVTRGRVWSVMAFAPFAFGWWRKQFDFRAQGYGLAIAGAVATALYAPHPPLSLALSAAVAYAFVHCTLWSGDSRFLQEEREALRLAASLVTTLGLTALVWKLVPGDDLGIAWLGLAVVLFEAGRLDLPGEFRRQAYAVAVLGVARAIGFDLDSRLVLVSAVLTYGLAARAYKEEGGRVTALFTFPGTLFLVMGLRALLPVAGISPAWALVAAALAECGLPVMQAQAAIVSAIVFARCVAVDFDSTHTIVSVAPVVACYLAALFRRELGSKTRLYYSVLAAGLLGTLIYNQVSGSVLTIAWGLEGVALLAAGFPLHDRVLRLSGLGLLTGCIGKLFFWDLSYLETLPRIFSFIVLGALLVGVSWVYTRFREQVQRYL